ncbi:hypothetical protein HK104_004411 [Borealophlyctis nickersoniae]|nr:hypothetical protein HK104_004411 [Borealophlyctis nickersoniae]
MGSKKSNKSKKGARENSAQVPKDRESEDSGDTTEEEKVKDPRENEGGKRDGGKEGMGMGAPQIPPLKTSQATKHTEGVSGVPPIGFSARDWDDVDYVQAGQILRYLDAAIEGNDQAGNIVFNLGGAPYLIRKLPRTLFAIAKVLSQTTLPPPQPQLQQFSILSLNRPICYTKSLRS